MAKDKNSDDFIGPIRRLLVGLIVIALMLLFLVWRIDSPRVERFRAAAIDKVVPSFDWAMAPITGMADLVTDFQSYQQLSAQNQDLRRELQQMKAWKEAALQLEQENAKLLGLNNVQLDPELTYVTGVVIADSGSPFRQSVLVNVGARDGIIDGWPTMDGIGLVGRIAGVGQETSRVMLLSDTSSRIPVTIQPSGQKAILAGDNTLNPPLEFLEDPAMIRPGDRVVSSGDGGVFPADLLVGQAALDGNGRLRVRLAADYQRLEFLRVLRAQPHEVINDPGDLLAPEAEFFGPAAPTTIGAVDG
ncbi:rod shape-determining protein MreC [Yoonia sediminilitoris]|uniref:Cell shape-determining protein MreC n=1 Tax=Yoonia sediminilitoris TaxID=1286148 RepID=A0A2T6KKH4_9RHOB|nr:rod shape-determining protein MreC [Yoonia sediminilitoris]PUB16419.1 rod shape-determining protein MreC [Yoonia sediminilitoris]RCW96768.1 rod shape-determining protein MreC [Yoonia sediminilitoris]